MANEETPSEGLTSSLFDRIKEFFTGMWESLLSLDYTAFIPFGHGLGESISEAVEARFATHMAEALVKQVDRLEIPTEFKNTLAEVVKDGDFDSVLLGYLMVFNYYASYIGGHAGIAGELASHRWRNEYRPTLPDVGSLIIALYRDPTKQAEVKDMLHKHGYTDDRINTLFAASKSVLAPDELKFLFLRGEIDEGTLNTGFKKYGFSDSEIIHLKKLFYPIPSYPDLIRMAVREAFYPDYVEEYGLLAELPSEYMEWTAKQGLSETWAKHYWASHWELPSLLRGYEMLHRGVIDEEQLNDLFMAQDVMPWWRDKLRAISYNPLTRVDVRRVYKMGIIDRDQVKRTYLDLGYDEEKAEWLTLFTEMQNTEQDRDLTKAEVLTAYVKNIIGYEETKGMLIDLGYNEEEVNILISTREYQWYKEEKTRELARIKKYYLAGAYSLSQTINELGRIDLVGSEQDSIIKLWDSEKLSKLRYPTKKDLDALFTGEIIAEGEYLIELEHLGYAKKYRNWYLALIKKQMEGE
jgi:hypothetical protein